MNRPDERDHPGTGHPEPGAGETCWTLIDAASRGDPDARELFARHYAQPIRDYLRRRWVNSPRRDDVADAQQEVFVECMKPGGALDRADAAKGDFRALLYGVVRNVARRFEERAARELGRAMHESVFLDGLPHQAEALSRVFDRSWAQMIMQEAAAAQERAARDGDEAYRTRFRILQLRHRDGLPVREIARQLGVVDVESVQNAYRRARRDFRACLRLVVATHTGAPANRVDEECRRVLEMLEG
ncbi:MAG: sigma-70 family RNA polymerase sigma factor [Planctomycetota bacterium]